MTNDGDLISREQAIEAFSDMREGYPIIRNDKISVADVVEVIKQLPPADIMECARALKRHCINAEDCRKCFMWDECRYELSAPCNWDLPTPWADDSIFENGGAE